MKIAKKNPGLNPQKLSEKAFKRMFGGNRNPLLKTAKVFGVNMD